MFTANRQRRINPDHDTAQRRKWHFAGLYALIAFILLIGAISVGATGRVGLPGAAVLGAGRYLFIDDALIDWKLSNNVHPVVNPPQVQERVIAPDQPWEHMGYHYFGQVMPYGLSFDGHVYKYILYYRRLGALTSGEDDVSDESGLYCVALSDDGIAWVKPQIPGSTPFEGQATNCTEHGNQFVLVDPNALPAERYKKIGHMANGGFGVTGISGDGIVFAGVEKRLGPVHSDGVQYHLDAQNVGWWDASSQSYRFLLRGRLGDFIVDQWRNSRRSFHYGAVASPDLMAPTSFILDVADTPNPFANWTIGSVYPAPMYALTNELPPVMEADDDDWRDWQGAERNSVDVYHTSAIPYPWAANTYLAFPTLYYHYSPNTTPAALSGNDGEFEPELAVSRDGQSWRRYRQADRFPSYVERGRVGNIDLLMASMTQGMIREGNEIYQYFIGLPRTHAMGAYFDGVYQSIYASDETIQRWESSDRGGIYRLSQRLDGFVSVESCRDEGVLISKAFSFSGDELALNFRTLGEGYVDVALLNAAGQILPAFNYVRMQGDSVDQVVTWPGQPSLADMAGQSIRLSLRLRDAKVFAFEIGNSATRTSVVSPEATSLAWAPTGEGTRFTEIPTLAQAPRLQCAQFPPIYQAPAPTPTPTPLPTPETWPPSAVTVICQPDPAPETMSADGHAERVAPGEDFETLQSGSGTQANSTTASGRIAWLAAGDTQDRFDRLRRGIITCDTSAVPIGVKVLDTDLYLFGIGKSEDLGQTDLVVVESSPVSDNAVTSRDYTSLGAVEYGRIPWTEFRTDAYYTVIALDPSVVTPGGITRLGLQLGWDLDGTFSGVWQPGGVTDYSVNFGEAGANVPYLQIVYDPDFKTETPTLTPTPTPSATSTPSPTPTTGQTGQVQVCSSWVQVNDGAFGIGTGGDSDYSNEEGFEALVFQNRGYLGMEADNLYGARLWRTKPGVTAASSQADWEEVIADGAGCPFGDCSRQDGLLQNDHIDSLAEFGGALFASTANGGGTTQGTQVWRSSSGDPGSWVQANSDGFGDPDNTNFKDIQVFDGWLCGGTQNWDGANWDDPGWNPGSQVWCTQDGSNWVQKNENGFGQPATIEVWSGFVFEDNLYLGVQNFGADRNVGADDLGKLYRTSSLTGTPVWTEVYSGAAGSRRTDILGELNGFLYISERSVDAQTGQETGIRVLRSDSGEAGTWAQVNVLGMDGDPNNIGTVVDGAAVFENGLYVGVTNANTGFELWQTNGLPQQNDLVDWQHVGSSGLGDANNIYAELIPFGGYLYAWTSNYVSGQQVRRSDCPPATPTATPIAPALPFNDGFDAALDWTANGDVTWYTGSPKNGTHSVRLRVLGSIEKTISTVGFQSISVSFALGANSLDNSSEYVQALWFDGAAWALLKQISDTDPEENNLLNDFTFQLPSAAENNPNLALRFRINGNSTGDYGYVDDVVVSGFPTGSAPTATPTIAATSTPTHSPTSTPTPTATATRTPTVPANDLIFADGFESGNISAWSGSATGGGDLSVTAAATLQGNRGLQTNINDNTSLHVRDTRPAAEARYRARFWFDPNSIAMTSGDLHTIFAGRSGSVEVFRIHFRRSSASYQVRVQIRTDAGTYTSGTWYTITDAPHAIEIDWLAAATAGANSGSISLWVDGALKQTKASIDNDTLRVDEARLGPLASIDTGTRGVLYFDAFESRRTTYIGP